MKSKLTQKRVRELFDYDPYTGYLRRKITVGTTAQKGYIVGSPHIKGYLRVGIDYHEYLVHRVIWLWWYGYLPENDIDHIDRVRINNHLSNLRESSRQCNLRNSKNFCTNTSGVKGVYFNQQRGKWVAQIKINNRSKYLGQYISFSEAVCARLAAEQCLNWEGCDSSSPAYKYVQTNIIKK